ncbi:MAG: hypothetical protein ACE5JR_10960 [Gemmatimonadota bacterium]
MKPASLLAVILLSLIALAHVLRLLLGIELTAGGSPFPMWPSVLAVLVFGGVAWMLWREGRS